jgi:hypothetical protein
LISQRFIKIYSPAQDDNLSAEQTDAVFHSSLREG